MFNDKKYNKYSLIFKLNKFINKIVLLLNIQK